MPNDDAASNEGDWRSLDDRAASARKRQHILVRKQQGVKIAAEHFPAEEAKYKEERKAERNR